MISQNNGEVRDQHCDNVLYTTGKNTTTFVKKKKKKTCVDRSSVAAQM